MHLSDHRAVLGILHLIALAKAFRRHKDPSRRAAGRHLSGFYERAWSEAAKRLGGTYQPLGADVGEIVIGDCRLRVIENYTSIDDPVTLAVASSKPLTYRILAKHHLKTPRYDEFTLKDLSRAIAFMGGEGRRECVVKPSSGTGGGRGIMTGIRSRWDLARAAAAAAVYGDQILIEEHLEGDNYRLLYLDGVLIDSFVRRPPNVIADGRSTILRLVQLANAARLRHGSGLSQDLLTIDLDMRRTLEKRGLSLHSIPAEGTVVTLKTVINENCGSDNTSATHLLCDSVIADGSKAARAVGVRLAGVDIITTDPGAPLAESGGAILEVNTPPNYYYHYHKRDGAFPVALTVLERLLAEHRRTTGTPLKTATALPHEERLPC
jgi:D-alanine-D-alanine ligase-like ATP-grasp enzyme